MYDGSVDVIVPVYNAEQYLQDCVDSVLSQSYQKYNLYLIDDGSTDSSFELCCKYAQKYPNVFVIHKENGGLPSARNVGIKKSNSEWVFFLDSDDIIDKFCLENLINGISNSDNMPDIIQCKFLRDKNEFDSSSCFPKCLFELEKLIQDFLKSEYVDIIVCAKLWNHNLVSLLFDEECLVLEDVEFLSRALLRADRMVILDYGGYYYRITPGSLINQGLNLKKFKASIAAHRKCISNLQKTKYKKQTIVWYYSSLFNWMVRVYNEEADDADEITDLGRSIAKNEWNEIKRTELPSRIKIAIYLSRFNKKIPYYLCAIRRKK